MPNARAEAVAAVVDRLGHRFADPALLERALTHSSVGEGADKAAGKPARHNERLEFLGDRVLGLLVADRLHEAMSDGGVVTAGTPIEVVGAQGTSLVVRRREATEKPAEPRPERPQPPPVCSETPAIRSETLEAFDFDSLDRPPA